MALEDKVKKLREEISAQGGNPAPKVYQKVSKARISAVLREIDRYSADQCDAVFALLDDQNDSWFTRAKTGTRFCDGASTSHIACHIGILQRDDRKLDREGRDYWLKPMWELGAIEKVYFDSKSRAFLPGHPVSKSSNSSYKLADAFKAILKAPEKTWREELRQWIQKDKVRLRLELQARLAAESRQKVDTKHSDLIRASCTHYVPHFLPNFKILYIDEGDGERITTDDREQLNEAGLTIRLDDSMPDVLLWNPDTDFLWVIEAVTSDGEVDIHKVNNLTALANRGGKAGIGFTTAYLSWSTAAKRQRKYKNIAPGTYIWIQEDPSKHFLAETFELK